MGNNFRIYYYTYYDPSKEEMAEANVYELAATQQLSSGEADSRRTGALESHRAYLGI